MTYIKRILAASIPFFVLNTSLYADVDWRSKGAVTPVKNQGCSCHSDYAFSTTGAVEGAHAIQTGTLISLSEQQLVDCSSSPNSGCGGGEVSPTSFDYIINTGGMESEASYPYTARNGTCKFNPSHVAATISGFTNIPAGDEAALTAVVNQQPVSVAIRGGVWFETYTGGIANPNCNTGPLRYVLVVGYTSSYWIIKNSYGTSWGASGYLYLPRYSNKCGIADYASYPTV